MRLLFVGFGNVGRALARLLLDRGATGSPGFRVVGIETGSHGSCADPAGLDLADALARYARDGGFGGASGQAVDLDYDVLVEMSPLDVAARGEPAIGRCRAALERGRHVVTCNKGPVAWAWRELSRLAAARGATLLCESTVMDGAPVFNLRRHCLRGLRVVAVEGVLNSTTNVALEGMEKGLPLAAALLEAQRLGVAEADPSLDVDGWDAAVKLAVLANTVLDGVLVPERVERESLRSLDGERVRAARRRGTPVKMVCRAEAAAGRVVASVRAEEVPAGSVLAGAAGTTSVLRLRTDLPGTFTVVEEHPTVSTTAYGALADLLEVSGARGD